jgi:hypothetical protein
MRQRSRRMPTDPATVGMVARLEAERAGYGVTGQGWESYVMALQEQHAALEARIAVLEAGTVRRIGRVG